MENQTVALGKIYQHFKGNKYRIIAIAEHTETGEKLVIYESVQTKKQWARPYDAFISEVDHQKYPEVKQKRRFELVQHTL
ncbi:DUF1653 domain-containing protein [bacterium]|nr:DUF1653 domain-containing protein [bacterium]